jgi:hypothetical protein
LTSLLEAWKKRPICATCKVFLKMRENVNRAMLCETARACDSCPKDLWAIEFGALLVELDKQAKTAWDIYLKVKAAYDYHYPQTREFREKTPDEEWIPLSAIHGETKKETTK